MQARVTFKKVFGFGGDLTTCLWGFRFVITPSSWGNPEVPDENTYKQEWTRQLTAPGGSR